MTNLENRFLRKVGAVSSLVYGLGWMLGGICSLAGDKMILSAIHSPATGHVEAGANLALAWWLEVFANVVFAFSDFGIIIAFAAFGILYRSACPIYRILCFTIAVWMTISVGVDTFLAGASWQYGLVGNGTDPERIAAVWQSYLANVINILRFPVGGMYLFLGCAMFLLGWLLGRNAWARGLRVVAFVFGAVLIVEAGIEVAAVLFVRRPIPSIFAIPLFILNLIVVAPWFGIRFARSFRGIEAPE